MLFGLIYMIFNVIYIVGFDGTDINGQHFVYRQGDQIRIFQNSQKAENSPKKRQKKAKKYFKNPQFIKLAQKLSC